MGDNVAVEAVEVAVVNNKISTTRGARTFAEPMATMRRGVSLLELVLAMSISVVVLALVAMGMRLQLQTFEKRRDRVEQGQLARAILRQIGDDIRSSIVYRPLEMDGVDQVASSSGASAIPGAIGTSGVPAATPSSGATLGSGSNSLATGASTPASAGSTNPPSTGTAGASNPASGAVGNSSTGSNTANGANQNSAAQSPAGQTYSAGFWGDATSIEFDMSRLPRLDEYSTLVSLDLSNPTTQIPSDVRTVSYFLEGSFVAGPSSTESDITPTVAPVNNLGPLERRNLLRTQRDRSVAEYGDTQSTAALTNQNNDEIVAEELTRLEFRYFDGYQWTTDWDSDSRGGLPMAVEIVIGLMDGKENPSAASTDVAATSPRPGEPQEYLYRLVVRIPTAEPLDPSAIPVEEETPVADQSTNTNTAAGTTPTNTQVGTPAAGTGTAAAPAATASPALPGQAGNPGAFGGGGRQGGGGSGNSPQQPGNQGSSRGGKR